MGHLDSQRSMPVFGQGRTGFSSTAKKLRLAADQKVVILNAPEGYTAQLSPGPADIGIQLQPAALYDVVQLFVNTADELRREGPAAIRAVLGEITSVTGYKPVAFVAIDDYYTALRFKRA